MPKKLAKPARPHQYRLRCHAWWPAPARTSGRYLSPKEDRMLRSPAPSAGLDLGEVEDLVDEGEQMATGSENVIGVLGLFLVELAE